MTRGRLWVCWDHCQAAWLTLPTYFHPHLKCHTQVLWSTEELFTLCMVVPSTVRSLCIFRALTSLVAHVSQSHLDPGAFLILENPVSGEWPWQLQTLFQRSLFWSWEWPLWSWELCIFTVANDSESSECWQHIVSGTVMVAKEINVGKNLTSFLYVLSKSWCYWWWKWSPNT